MKIRIIAFGIAKDLLANTTIDLELKDSTTVADLKNELQARNPEFKKLRNLRFAVNEEYCDDGYEIRELDEVVIIPPVSGG